MQWAHFPSVQDEENVCHDIANVTNSLEEEAPEVWFDFDYHALVN